MQSFAEVLKLVKEYFVEKVKNNELTETAYNCWIKNIEPIRLENNTAVLFVPHNFHRNILVEQYKSRIEEAFGSDTCLRHYFRSSLAARVCRRCCPRIRGHRSAGRYPQPWKSYRR